jgi:hypothetical protein
MNHIHAPEGRLQPIGAGQLKLPIPLMTEIEGSYP